MPIKRQIVLPSKWVYDFNEVATNELGVRTHEELRLKYGVPKDLTRKIWLGDMRLNEFLYICEALNIDPRKCIKERG